MLKNLGLLSLLPLFTASTQGVSIAATRDFPLGSEVENIVLRPCGSALTVVGTFPGVYEVEPKANATPRLIHDFNNTQGAHGTPSITASPLYPDVFFVITGFFNFSDFTPEANSYAIHRLSFDEHGQPIVKELARLDAIRQPNGMIAVPDSPFVLIADTLGGFIYRFNTETNELSQYFDDALLKAPDLGTHVFFGINGLKLSRGYLYFSNTNQQLMARIPASGLEMPSLTGTQAPEVITRKTACDDFIVNPSNGDLYIAEQGFGNATVNGVGFVPGDKYGNSTAPVTIAGGPNSTALLGPTAVIWAEGKVGKTLLVTTTGGFTQFVTGNYTGGGTVSIVDLDH